MTGTELKSMADRFGLLATLSVLDAKTKLDIPLSREFLNLPITELNLSVRSCNGLRRAKIDTIGNLVDTIRAGNGLESIRNIGKKSIAEIRQVLLEESYNRLKEPQKEQFWSGVSLEIQHAS